jgi:multidrug efflux system membrane fusion protein
MNDTTTAPSQAEASENERRSEGMSRGRRRLRNALIGLAIVLLIVWIVHHGTQAPASPFGAGNGQDEPIAVDVASATRGEMPVSIPALGTVTPLATVTVKTQISGQLVQVAFKEGQMVQQGDFLAQIDPRPYQAALEQAQGNLRRDRALLANAKVDQTRYQGLLAEDSIAKQQLDTQVALVEQYEGTVVGDEAQIATARLNLQYTHIVSPVTGRVGLRQVDAGNYVTPGDTNGLVVVTQLQPITVIFPVPEDYVRLISQRLHGGSSLSVTAWDRDNSAKLAQGKLLTVDNQIDPTTGTIKLRAEFDNKDGALFANQFVNIRLLVDVLHDQIIIPSAAVHRGAPNGVATTFVYRVNAARKVAVQPVSLGQADGERVAVLSGLVAGDVVVTEGADRLRDGATVVLPDPTAPAGATGATGAVGAVGAVGAAGAARAAGAAGTGAGIAH